MDTAFMLYTPVMTARAVGYNSFMPSYPHIEQYRTKLQELIEFGGSDWMPTATTTGNDWC